MNSQSKGEEQNCDKDIPDPELKATAEAVSNDSTSTSIKDSKTEASDTPKSSTSSTLEKENPELSYLFVNGQNNVLTATNVEMKNGELINFENLSPFNKSDNNGNKLVPTLDDANQEKRRLYQIYFRKPFKNILILSGAGSSIDVGLPLMSDLWDEVEKRISSPVFKELCKKINHPIEEKNFESLISRLEGVIEYGESVSIQGITLITFKERILEVIRKKTKFDGDVDGFPHVVLLEKLLQRKQTGSRLKVFTLNYDLLFEKAANKINAVVMDGFSFTSPRTFSGRYFDYDIVNREGSKVNEEDNFITRVFHLYKLHGSLNWHKIDDNDDIIINDGTNNPLIIYPREAKYKDSYAQPFFEMIARFQRNLRLDNDTLLICIGYSFNDNHINAAIEEAINQNPGFRLAVIDPYLVYAHNSGSLAYKKVVNYASQSERIMVVSERFSDFANYFPDIQTYYNEPRIEQISLRNEVK